MSSSVSLYTLGNMERAKITAVTNAAAGFPKENMVDYNPDSYWKQSGDAEHEIDINLGEAKTPDAIVLLVHDYLSSFLGTTFDLHSDDNDDGLYTATTSERLYSGKLATTIQLFVIGFTGADKQYWRLKINLGGGSTTAPELSGLFLTRKYTISQGNEWPEPDLETYHNRGGFTAGGRSFVSAINRNKTETFQRTYQLDQTDMTALQNAFNDSRGSLFPLILQEGTTDVDARFVRFADNSLNRNQIDYQLYRPTVTFVTQPFISDGEAY